MVPPRCGGRLQHSAALAAGRAGDVVDMVVPELQRRGLYRTAYEGSTLRENPGILYGAFGKVAYRSAAD